MMLKEGMEKIKTPLDSTCPISHIWEQIQQGQALATAAGQPFTKPQLINMAYHAIFILGLVTEAYRDWKCTPVATQTWVNLKIHFNCAHQEILELQQATQQAAGYIANNIFHTTHPQTFKSNFVAEALVNLAQATEADHTTVSSLATANMQLTTEVANLTTKTHPIFMDT
eukprot:9748824-Ditylum_brightwellii.AAC.1